MSSVAGMRATMEAQREKTIKEVDSRKSEVKQQIKSQFEGQKDKINSEMGPAGAEGRLRGAIDSLRGQISNLETAKASLPPGHPEIKKVEKAISTYKKRLSETMAQLSTIRYRKSSQLKLLGFRQEMQLKNVDINFSNQKSLILRQFAERFMQLKEQEKAQRAAYAQVAAQQAAGAFAERAKRKVDPTNPEKKSAAAG